MAMYDRTRSEGFGAEVKRRIMLGTYALSAGYYDAHYLKAQQVRTLIRRDYERALETVDAVLMPTSPVPRSRSASASTTRYSVPAGRLHRERQSDRPACDQRARRLHAGATPIGVQLVGRAFDEETLLRIADGYERLATWWQEAPPAS